MGFIVSMEGACTKQKLWFHRSHALCLVPKLPITSAYFLGDTGKVVVSGRRKFFYFYDSIAGKLDHVPRISGREEKSLEKCVPSPDGKTIAFCGNDGYIILVDVDSKQWMASLKMNGSVRAIAFTPDGEYILASGSDGDVYVQRLLWGLAVFVARNLPKMIL